MSDIRPSLEVIAPTVDEAIQRGADELGVPVDYVTFEILDEGSKGLLGLGTRQARVRVSVVQDAGVLPVAPVRPAADPIVEDQAPDSEEDETLRVTRETVVELLERMGFQAAVKSEWGEEPLRGGIRPLKVDITGKDLSTLIGRHGETLAALQYITRLIVSKELKQPAAVIIDVEGFRSRRERQLRQMARRLAAQAIERGRTLVLEPMPANERRIIHLELQDHAEVTTESIGEGERRKVTIIPRSQ